MPLKIITYRDPQSAILFRPLKKIKSFGKDLQKIAKNMRETLVSLEGLGLGLAASQVNIDQAICVIKVGKRVRLFCNPEITFFSPEKEILEEGCLSFPDLFFPIVRSQKIKVEFFSLKGQKKMLEAEGVLARVLQHEIDHLNGVVFMERK